MLCRLLSSRLSDLRPIHQIFSHSPAGYPEEIPSFIRTMAAYFLLENQYHQNYPRYSLHYSLSYSDDYSFSLKHKYSEVRGLLFSLSLEPHQGIADKSVFLLS